MTDLTELLARAIGLAMRWTTRFDNDAQLALRLRIWETEWPEAIERTEIDPGPDYPSREECRETARSQLAALDAAGYQIVPKEPTEEMIDAARPIEMPGSAMLRPNEAAVYAAMLAAAPKP